MLRHRCRAALAVAAFTTVVLTAAPALAHEHRTVGALTFTVGWKNEPTYSGVNNAVQVFLADAAGKPVTDLGGGSFNVQAVFGNQTSEVLAMHAAFGKTYGTPGEYNSSLMPTRPGTYTFHFTGTINGQKVDEAFTSSDATFSNVENAQAIQFPAKDPSSGELAAKLTNLDPRIESLQAAQRAAASKASSATTVAIIGVVVGALGLLVALVALGAGRKRRSAGVSRRESVTVT